MGTRSSASQAERIAGLTTGGEVMLGCSRKQQRPCDKSKQKGDEVIREAGQPGHVGPSCLYRRTFALTL